MVLAFARVCSVAAGVCECSAPSRSGVVGACYAGVACVACRVRCSWALCLRLLVLYSLLRSRREGYFAYMHIYAQRPAASRHVHGAHATHTHTLHHTRHAPHAPHIISHFYIIIIRLYKDPRLQTRKRNSVPRRAGYSPVQREGYYVVRVSLSVISPFHPVKGGTWDDAGNYQ